MALLRSLSALIAVLLPVSHGAEGLAPCSEMDIACSDQTAMLQAMSQDAVSTPAEGRYCPEGYVPAAVRVHISSKRDDAEEGVGAGLYRTSSDIEMGWDDANFGAQLVGLRFQRVEVPAHSKILNAKITFRVEGDGNTAAFNVAIRMQRSADAPGFPREANLAPISRVLETILNESATSEVVSWSPPADEAGTETDGSVTRETPPLNILVQRIVDLPEWAAGNAMVFLFKADSTGEAQSREYYSFDGSQEEVGSGELAPKLSVEYCDPSDCAATKHVAEAAVIGSHDDVEEAVSPRLELDTADKELELGSPSGGQRSVMGLRFTGLPVPAMAKILKAKVFFTIQEAGGCCSATFESDTRMQRSADAPAFPNALRYLADLYRTEATASVTFSPPVTSDESLKGTTFKSSDIAPLLQEVVDIPGWSAGNAVVVMFLSPEVELSQQRRRFVSYDKRPSAAPQLRVDFCKKGPRTHSM